MIDIDRLRSCLEDAQTAEPWLRSLCVANLPAAHANFTRMADHGVTLDLLTQISEQFAAAAPTLADPDMAINNLERFIAASRNPMATAALFERDPDALPSLLQIFSTSQYLSDLLVSDKEAYDLLRMTEGQAVARLALADELENEVRSLRNYNEVLARSAASNAARRFASPTATSFAISQLKRSFVKSPTLPTRSSRRHSISRAAICTNSMARHCGPTSNGAASSSSVSASSAASSSTIRATSI